MALKSRLALVALKIGVASILIGWLLYSGTVDFAALRVFLDRPLLPAVSLAVLAFNVVIGAMRWRLLLSTLDVRITAGRALQLHTTAAFFNVAVPGGIGGDIVKAIYVARDELPAKRPNVYLITFADRLLGVGSMLLVGAIMVIARGPAAWDGQLRQVSLIVTSLAVLSIVAPIVLLVLARRASSGARHGIIGRLVEVTRHIASQPIAILKATAMAVAGHAAGIVLFTTLAAAISTQDVSLFSVATVYPLGLLTIVLPISMAGIGVGHIAFERLFTLIGLSGGANVFNLYFIGQTAPCLLGVIPYLALRRRAPPPTESEVTEHAVAPVSL
jgi:hypothetical protein